MLSRTRLLVYRALYALGPMTAHELDAVLAHRSEVSASYHKRLSELLRMGVVANVGERPCRITRMTAVLWDVTSALPIKLPPKLSRAARYRKLLLDVLGYMRDEGMLEEVAVAGERLRRIDAEDC